MKKPTNHRLDVQILAQIPLVKALVFALYCSRNFIAKIIIYILISIVNLINRKDDITFLIPVKNKPAYVLLNSLKSIRYQNISSPTLVSIILVDYGSEQSYSEQYKNLCKAYKARYLRIEGVSGWNKSKCLNAGLRLVKTKYASISDVDIIYQNNYFKNQLDAIKKDKYRIIYCSMLNSPQHLIKSAVALEKRYLALKESSILRGKNKTDCAYGSGICMTFSCLFKIIGGYDEFYEGWGEEDRDIIRRFKWMGLPLKNIYGKTSHIHQWHNNDYWPSNITPERKAAFEKNRDHYNNSWTIIRKRKKEPK